MQVLAEASRIAAKGEDSVTDYLVEKNIFQENELLGILANRLGVPPIDLARVKIPQDLTEVVSTALAAETACVPISKIGGILTIAVSNPFDVVKHDDLRLATGCDLRLALALESQVTQAQRVFYDTGDPGLSDILDDVDPEMQIKEHGVGEEADVVDLALSAGDDDQAPVIKLVNFIVYNAIKAKASDIHIEPQEKRVVVRYRIDGALEEAMEAPKRLQNAMASRLKIMAGLDIAEKRRPQDGKFQVKAEGRQIDFRVSSLPLVHGEKIVLRILDASNLALNLDSLGFEDKALSDFKNAIESPYGMILVTGPTGSGKTTTLYSAVKEIMSPEQNFVTVEDPVEYQVEGLNQVQVNPKSGLTFASALRSILRQDPDVVMIGEIRDSETIGIAIKAALTGHLVLSTLHTNDAAGTLSRMMDMGVDPFMVASATLLVSAQRLMRTLCPHCRQEAEEVRVERLRELGYLEADIEQGVTLHTATGCARCSQGYAGRFAILETLPITEPIKKMIVHGHSAVEVRNAAIEDGMITLRRAALLNAMRGKTSIEEVLRVTLSDQRRATQLVQESA
jgi:type IV pilus assembly protein PilB